MSGGRSVHRLWRPAAQRQVRNAWAMLHAHRSAWTTSSVALVSSATALVNASLSLRYLQSMDLGVLEEMDGIRNKVQVKLQRQQEGFLEQLLASYSGLVTALNLMLQTSKSMRTYIKGSGDGPIIEFSNEPSIDGDNGDGAGVPVFATLPLSAFEMLADEVVAMYEAELKVKWLLVSELYSIVYPEAKVDLSQEGLENFCKSEMEFRDTTEEKTSLLTGLPNLVAKSDFWNMSWSQVIDLTKKQPKGELHRDTLQVYLTTLLAEVNIDKNRIEDITVMVNDETNGVVPSSPTRISKAI